MTSHNRSNWADEDRNDYVHDVQQRGPGDDDDTQLALAISLSEMTHQEEQQHQRGLSLLGHQQQQHLFLGEEKKDINLQTRSPFLRGSVEDHPSPFLKERGSYPA